MSHVVFITGGQRSGKSRFAQQQAELGSANPVYLATARHWDDEFEQRILRHQADRSPNWQTVEEEKYIGALQLNGETVVLDCITLWLTNFFHDNGYNVDATLTEAKAEWMKFLKNDFRLFVVSNEIGMGVIAENEITRKFTDLQGWMNQFIASQANEVYMMISGIALKIK